MTEQIDPRLKNEASTSTDLISLLSQKVVGQSSATKAIVPYVYMYQSGLAPEGRPAGVFLLLGPTGTGKTKTVEAIAELLPEARDFLLARGVSEKFGARELKRVIHRQLTQPLATMVTRREINSNALVQVSVGVNDEELTIREVGTAPPPAPRPSILIVDDNHDLLMFLATELREAGWEMLIAENAGQARRLFYGQRPGAVLLDYMLGEDDGLKLGLELSAQAPATKIIIMTGGGLSDGEVMLCAARNFPILFKPFLAQDILNFIRGSYQRTFTAGAGSISTAESEIRAGSA